MSKKPKPPKQLTLPTMQASNKPIVFQPNDADKLIDAYHKKQVMNYGSSPVAQVDHDDLEIIAYRSFVDAGYCTEAKHDGFSVFTFTIKGIQAGEKYANDLPG